MSATVWVARLEFIGAAGLPTIYSTSNEVVQGDLSLEPGVELEQLDSPGVNHQRHRERRRHFQQLVLRLVEDFAVYDAVLLRETKYHEAEGALARLTFKVGGIVREWDRTTVVSVRNIQRVGKLVGVGANPSSAFALVSEWTLQRNKSGLMR